MRCVVLVVFCVILAVGARAACVNKSSVLVYGHLTNFGAGDDVDWPNWFRNNIPGSTLTVDTSFGTITAAGWANYDLVILGQNRVRLISASESQEVVKYLDNGGAVIALAGFTNDQTDITYQEGYFSALGVTYEGNHFIDNIPAPQVFNQQNPLAAGLKFIDFAGGWPSTPYTGPGTSELLLQVSAASGLWVGQTIQLPSGGRIVLWGDEWVTFVGLYGNTGDSDGLFWKNAVAWSSNICVPGATVNQSPCEANVVTVSSTCASTTASSTGLGFTLAFSDAVSTC